MHERRKEEKRDEQLSGELFRDWDNPEDLLEEDAPQGYYVQTGERPLENDEDDDSYVPDEDDPDYDLSEAAGYADWEPKRETIIPQWVIVGASLLLILAMLVPLLIRIS
jgi:hypothetical protein